MSGAPLYRAQVTGQPSSNGAATEPNRYEGRVLDVRTLLREPDQPIPWRCEGVAADGYLTTLAGRGGEGKSLLALGLACGVARGTAAAGIGCTQGKAIVFDAENGPRLIARRLRAAGVTVDLAIQPVDAGGLHLARDLTWFREMIVEHASHLAVFDSLRVLSSGAKENDADEMEPLITALKHLARETEVAILLIHHRGRSEGSDFRGSSVILDQTDLLFTLGRVPGDPESRFRRKITTIKCRIDEEPAERWVRIEANRSLGLLYVDGAEPYEDLGTGGARPRDTHRAAILGLLGDGVVRSVRAIGEATGPSRSTVHRLLGEMETEGSVVRSDDGQGWRVSHSDNALGGGTGGTPRANGSTEPDSSVPGGVPQDSLWDTPADVGLGRRCSCEEPGEIGLDGCCSRCLGWPGETT